MQQNAVQTLLISWTDPHRERSIPVKAYYPEKGRGPFPVILFSHGLGGSREGYTYLGNYWAGQGYIVLHLQHAGSDSEIWKDAPPGDVLTAMRRAASQPRNTQDRIFDIKFAIDQLAALNDEPGPLQRRLDLSRIGVAGHSYGALTSLAIAGQTFITAAGARSSSPDPRVRAIIAMSAPPPKNKELRRAVYASVRLPCLHITGTRDVSPLGASLPEDRRAAFDNSVNSSAFLIDFKDGDHMVFAGLKRNSARAQLDDEILRLTQISSTAYWDAFLKENPSAKSWLTEGGLADVLDGKATLESHLPAPKQGAPEKLDPK
jgi:predicted dienelactone hydrolase